MEHTTEKIPENKRFSIVARAKSFTYAFRGIAVLFKTQHNTWIQAFATVIVTILGFWLHISQAEWGLIVFCITGVLAAEAFNTAIEFDIDLTSQNYHPYARDTKDVAAGAVLLTVLGAIVVGLIIFLPKLLLKL